MADEQQNKYWEATKQVGDKTYQFITAVVPGSEMAIHFARDVALPVGTFMAVGAVAPGVAGSVLAAGGAAGHGLAAASGAVAGPMMQNAPWAVQGIANSAGWVAAHAAPAVGSAAAAIYSGKLANNLLAQVPEYASSAATQMKDLAVYGGGVVVDTAKMTTQQIVDKIVSAVQHAKENKVQVNPSESNSDQSPETQLQDGTLLQAADGTQNTSDSVESPSGQEEGSTPNGDYSDDPDLNDIHQQLRDDPDLDPDIASMTADPEAEPEFEPKQEVNADETMLDLQNKLAQSGVNVGRLNISVNGEEVFKMSGGEVIKSAVTPEMAEMIKTALTDPANLKGSVVIKQGDKVLLNVRDGVVITDALRLTQQAAKADVTTPNGLLYNGYSKGVSNDFQGAQTVANRAIKAGVDPATVKEVLSVHSPYIKDLKESNSNNPDAAKNAVNNIVKGAERQNAVDKQGPQPQQPQKAQTASRGR